MENDCFKDVIKIGLDSIKNEISEHVNSELRRFTIEMNKIRRNYQSHGMTKNLLWFNKVEGWIAFEYKLNGEHHHYEYIELSDKKPRKWPKLC
jgi:hypothetical protein